MQQRLFWLLINVCYLSARLCPSLCLHSGPRLCATEHRDAKISPQKKFRSFAAEREPAPVGRSGLRIQNLAARIFRAVLRDPAHDDEADYERVLPLPGALVTARREFFR